MRLEEELVRCVMVLLDKPQGLMTLHTSSDLIIVLAVRVKTVFRFIPWCLVCLPLRVSYRPRAIVRGLPCGESFARRDALLCEYMRCIARKGGYEGLNEV